MLVFHTKLGIMRFPVSFSVLLFHFSVLDEFGRACKLSFRKNAQLIMAFHRSPFSVLLFLRYTISTVFLMLHAIWQFMLMILLSTVNVIRLLICGNSSSWLLNLNLICKTVGNGLGKPNRLHLIIRIILVWLLWIECINVKVGVSVIDESLSFKMLELSLIWFQLGVLTLSLLLQLLLRKSEPWFLLWSFFRSWLRFISLNRTSDFAWNIVMSGMTLLIATWICWMNYTNSYI